MRLSVEVLKSLLDKEYATEYESKELIQLKREARFKCGFFIEPEAKLLFIIRIRGVRLRSQNDGGPSRGRCHDDEEPSRG
ncbi:large ribosomal subunit protein uL30w-like [Wolffia australiana]